MNLIHVCPPLPSSRVQCDISYPKHALHFRVLALIRKDAEPAGTSAHTRQHLVGPRQGRGRGVAGAMGHAQVLGRGLPLLWELTC